MKFISYVPHNMVVQDIQEHNWQNKDWNAEADDQNRSRQVRVLSRFLEFSFVQKLPGEVTKYYLKNFLYTRTALYYL